MEIISVQFLALVPVVVGVVEALKRGLKIPSRAVPLVSLVVGVVGVYLSSHFVISGDNVLAGIAIGLTASGLYAGGKASFSSPE